jgi:hypothetical protein
VLRPASARRLALATLVAAGCAPPRDAGPTQTLDAFVKAVAVGKLDDAYALMSSGYKQTHDPEAFARSLGPSERRAAAHFHASKVELRAEVQLADGETLPLVEENGAWHFARDPLDFYPQRAPDEALRSFLRAVEHKRWEVVLRFVPDKYRAQVTVDALRERWDGERKQDLLQQLAAVRAHLTEPMEIAGDEARLPVGERKQVKLIREEGLWKVETLE